MKKIYTIFTLSILLNASPLQAVKTDFKKILDGDEGHYTARIKAKEAKSTLNDHLSYVGDIRLLEIANFGAKHLASPDTKKQLADCLKAIYETEIKVSRLNSKGKFGSTKAQFQKTTGLKKTDPYATPEKVGQIVPDAERGKEDHKTLILLDWADQALENSNAMIQGKINCIQNPSFKSGQESLLQRTTKESKEKIVFEKNEFERLVTTVSHRNAVLNGVHSFIDKVGTHLKNIEAIATVIDPVLQMQNPSSTVSHVFSKKEEDPQVQPGVLAAQLPKMLDAEFTLAASGVDNKVSSLKQGHAFPLEVETNKSTTHYQVMSGLIPVTPEKKIEIEFEGKLNQGVFMIGLLSENQGMWIPDSTRAYSQLGPIHDLISLPNGVSEKGVWIVFANSLGEAGISKFEITDVKFKVEQ